MKFKLKTFISSRPLKARGRLKKSFAISWTLSALFLLQFGCATMPPQILPEAIKTDIRKVGVVSADYEPKNNLHGYAKGKLQGLTGGVAGGAAGGALVTSYISASGGIIGFALASIYGPVIIGGGALVGGAFGTADAMPMEKVREIRDSVSRLLEEFEPQQDLADQILEEAENTLQFEFDNVKKPRPSDQDMEPDYKDVAGNIDTILEISVMEVGLVRGQTGRKHLGFFMVTRVRLINVNDGEELYYKNHYFRGREKTLAEWTDDDARLLREEWKSSYQVISQYILERVFMLTDLHPSSTTKRLYSGYCWLKPYYPKSKYNFIFEKLKFTKVDSVQPTLTWDSFPRDGDRMKAPDGLVDRVENVTYDLKIWRVEKKSPVELIYKKIGLTESSHVLEQPLEPETRYYWTLRANYLIDGHKRITGWSYSRNPGPILCDGTTIPYRNYFRFKTPSGYIDENVMNSS